MAVEFDAGPWFRWATVNDIRALANCGWGGDQPADVVAEDLARRDPNVKGLFASLDLIRDVPTKKNCHGFECRVDPNSAMAFLKNHRRGISEELSGGPKEA
jgi:hypothetical protein